jgi:glycolate oxidase
MFGHAGDGNVHVDVFKGDLPEQDWLKILPDLKKEIYRRALMLGGSITGEHGIGSLRKDYIGLMMSDVEIELQRRIKKAFDPKGILNPGKVFPNLHK